MKEIYKILISVFTVLMLTSTIGIATRPTPTPTPTPTPNLEQIQDSRLNSLETNDTQQQINNTAQQGLINGLLDDVNVIKNQILSMKDQINQLLSRTTNLETQTAIYSVTYSNRLVQNFNLETTIAEYDLNLTQPSYVYIEGTGSVENCQDPPNPNPLISFTLYRDDIILGGEIYDPSGQLIWVGGNCNGQSYLMYPQISTTTYLPAGLHLISLKAQANRAYVGTSLNIIVNKNGETLYYGPLYNGQRQTNIPTISNGDISIKDGKISRIKP